jgi:single-stranded DNA-binding protein
MQKIGEAMQAAGGGAHPGAQQPGGQTPHENASSSFTGGAHQQHQNQQGNDNNSNIEEAEVEIIDDEKNK